MQALTSAIPTGRYSLSQLTDALLAGSGAISPRFELLDSTLTRIGDLSTVVDAKVTMNADRAIKGGLDLTLQATDPLLPFSTVAFTRYIKPWFRLLMPDGGFAEWPQGVFIFNRPKRNVESLTHDEWTFSLGDRTHLLLAGGPGAGGYTVASGVKNTDAITQTLQTVFGSSVDLSGIVASTSVVASALTWDLAADQQSTNNLAVSGGTNSSGESTAASSGTSGTNGTTWADVIQALSAAIGYYSISFDGNGRPIVKPMPNLASSSADATYSDGARSILALPVVVDDDLASLANRVFVRSKNASPSSPTTLGVADLDTLIPTHPYAHANIGFYIDAVVDDTVAGSVADLNARARTELYSRAGMYQSVEITTQAWPVHEAFDVVGISWAGDVDFGTVKTLHEREWTLDLFTGETKRTLRRIVP